MPEIEIWVKKALFSDPITFAISGYYLHVIINRANHSIQYSINDSNIVQLESLI